MRGIDKIAAVMADNQERTLEQLIEDSGACKSTCVYGINSLVERGLVKKKVHKVSMFGTPQQVSYKLHVEMEEYNELVKPPYPYIRMDGSLTGYMDELNRFRDCCLSLTNRFG